MERIINGDLVGDSGLFPEVVLIGRPIPGLDYLFQMCTGTLLDENIVLTAAHCVNDHDNTNQQTAGLGKL